MIEHKSIINMYNEDCIEGMRKYIQSNSIDCIITDPPYGINGNTLDKHYNRDESKVVCGYTDIPSSEYEEFSNQWIHECTRVLKPAGSMYIVSGYTNLHHILNALHNENKLKEINHIIWKYNFGVYTKNKYVSSHYHILYWAKKGGKPTFNTYCRYEKDERMNGSNNSANYNDREDVFIINREYKPNQIKNKNELPHELLRKLIQYSTNKGDVILDPFAGGFSTAIVAKECERNCIGFEINKYAYELGMNRINEVI